MDDERLPGWIGPHRVVRKIGEGGMGSVFEVRGPDDQPYAAKLLDPAYASHPEWRKRFLREAKIASVVNHPGVVSIYELDSDPHLNTPFLLMELLEGESLDERLKRFAASQTRFEPLAATEIALQIAEALEAVHACGIVHRDLKPANVFIRRDPRSLNGERVTILDFGISKMRSLNAGTMVGSVFGTPYYMAPEQTVDTSQVDARCDLYSVGCVLHEMLAGRPPFDTNDPTIILRIRNEKPAPLSTLRPEISPALEAIVLRCLEKRPEDRYASAAALSLALLESLPPVPDEPVAEEAPVARTVFVRRALLGQPEKPAQPAGPRRPIDHLKRSVPLWFALGLAGVLSLVSVVVTRLATGGRMNDRPAPARLAVAPPAPAPAPVAAVDAAPAPPKCDPAVAVVDPASGACTPVPVAGSWSGTIAGVATSGERLSEAVTLTLLAAPQADGCGRLKDERCSSRLSRCSYDAAGKTFRATLVGCDQDVAITGSIQKNRLGVRITYGAGDVWTGSLNTAARPE